MTTLYHAPIACSLAVRIAAAEGGVPLDIDHVDLSTKEVASGGSLYDVNPLGLVSTLALDDGRILTENTAILLWVNAQSTRDGFHIAPCDPDYFDLVSWISFTASELHKLILRIVLYSEATDAVKDKIRALAAPRFERLSQQLRDRPFLLGEHFTAADAYLSWFFVLTRRAGLDIEPYPVLTAYQKRTHERPLIRALIDEDLALHSV